MTPICLILQFFPNVCCVFMQSIDLYIDSLMMTFFISNPVNISKNWFSLLITISEKSLQISLTLTFPSQTFVTTRENHFKRLCEERHTHKKNFRKTNNNNNVESNRLKALNIDGETQRVRKWILLNDWIFVIKVIKVWVCRWKRGIFSRPKGRRYEIGHGKLHITQISHITLV